MSETYEKWSQHEKTKRMKDMGVVPFDFSRNQSHLRDLEQKFRLGLLPFQKDRLPVIEVVCLNRWDCPCPNHCNGLTPEEYLKENKLTWRLAQYMSGKRNRGTV